MIDNRKVKDSHQGGIERIKQRSGDMQKGQGGKMSNAPKEKARWKRTGAGTPRMA